VSLFVSIFCPDEYGSIAKYSDSLISSASRHPTIVKCFICDASRWPPEHVYCNASFDHTEVLTSATVFRIHVWGDSKNAFS